MKWAMTTWEDAASNSPRSRRCVVPYVHLYICIHDLCMYGVSGDVRTREVLLFIDGGAPTTSSSVVQGHRSEATSWYPTVWTTWYGEDPDR